MLRLAAIVLACDVCFWLVVWAVITVVLYLLPAKS